MVNTYLLNGQWELCLDSKKEGLSQELYKQDAWKKQMEVKKDTIENTSMKGMRGIRRRSH